MTNIVLYIIIGGVSKANFHIIVSDSVYITFRVHAQTNSLLSKVGVFLTKAMPHFMGLQPDWTGTMMHHSEQHSKHVTLSCLLFQKYFFIKPNLTCGLVLGRLGCLEFINCSFQNY